MPANVFLVSDKVNKDFRKLPTNVKNRIAVAFQVIKTNPLSGKKLHGDLDGYYKYRIGDYRIVYEFIAKNSRVEIVSVEHRQGVYK